MHVPKLKYLYDKWSKVDIHSGNVVQTSLSDAVNAASNIILCCYVRHQHHIKTDELEMNTMNGVNKFMTSISEINKVANIESFNKTS